MNDQLFASELAAVLSAAPYSDFADLMNPPGATVPMILAMQAGEDTARPLLTISGEYQPYGPRRIGSLMMELRSRQGDEPAEQAHQERLTVLIASLLGLNAADREATASAKQRLRDAFALRGQVSLIDFGPSQNFLEATAEDKDLKTTLNFRAVWKFGV